MTGYGSAQGEVDGVEYAVEARSVNNRYFKASIRLPEFFSSAEGEIEKVLRSKLYRGTVTLGVKMKFSDQRASYRVNAVALGNYIDQLRPLEIEANPTLRIDLGSLLQLPGVCEPPPMEEVVEKTRSGLLKLIDETLDKLVEMRIKEGKAVEVDLVKNLKVIEENLSDIAKLAPQVVVDYKDRLVARVKDLTGAGKIDIDHDSFVREVTIFAERCDIAEELSRLAGHIKQARKAIDGSEPAGRKLDFIAQEMLREANTIASKANDADIAQKVVEIKTAIDRIKEQVQNIE